MKVLLSGLPEALVPVNPHLQTGSNSILAMMWHFVRIEDQSVAGIMFYMRDIDQCVDISFCVA